MTVRSAFSTHQYVENTIRDYEKESKLDRKTRNIRFGNDNEYISNVTMMEKFKQSRNSMSVIRAQSRTSNLTRESKSKTLTANNSPFKYTERYH